MLVIVKLLKMINISSYGVFAYCSDEYPITRSILSIVMLLIRRFV